MPLSKSAVPALASIATLVAALVMVAGASASAIRPPTPAESVTLGQALFDYYFTNGALASVRVRSARIEPLRPSPVRSRLVTKYAFMLVHAYGATGQDVGEETAIAVYFASPVRGWRVFNDGSSDVGCDMPAWYPAGQERTILHAFGENCR
jgi:hypothetical protein